MLESFPPFNIDLLLLAGSEATKTLAMKGIGQVKVMDIHVGMTHNFHPEGLYSTEIFGKVGDIRRSRNLGYIDLNLQIFHPVYYKAIVDLKELYGEILSGRSYAIFDHQLKDFIKSDILNGETGMKFFLEHFDKIKFQERDSAKRSFNIRLVEKFRKMPLMDKLLVLPAGLRDYTVDENGKPSEDEINSLYRKVLSIASVASNISVSINEEFLNSVRFNIQMAVNQIYYYITNILEGKGKLIQGKWAARNIDNSTRNVITPYIQKVKSRNDPQFVSAEQTVVGLYQFLQANFPKSVQLLRDGFLSKVFPGPNSPANLIDPKTLLRVTETVDPSYYDDWMTLDGLENQFYQFRIKDLRHEPVMIGPYYLGLMYLGPSIGNENGTGLTYKFVESIDELPKGLDKKNVHPITHAELFYLSVFHIAPKTPCSITRYPITGLGSIYPSYVYLKSTIKGLIATELDDSWTPTDKVAPEFPKLGDYFFDSLSPSSQHLGRLGGDYDGDTCSFICFWSDDAIQEINERLQKREHYLSVNGQLAYSSANDVINLVVGNLT